MVQSLNVRINPYWIDELKWGRFIPHRRILDRTHYLGLRKWAVIIIPQNRGILLHSFLSKTEFPDWVECGIIVIIINNRIMKIERDF